MTDPDPLHSNNPQHRAEAAPPAADSGAREQQFRENAVHPEAAFGGADAVEKTSYVVGSGTNPHAKAGASTAHPRGGGGPNYLAWGIGAVAAIVAVIYLFSLVA